jgi:uncharacterized protein YbjQ (UPF0145 family)
MTSTDAAAWLAGFIPDLPTPFDESGAVDFAAFAGLYERQIEAGISAIAVCETTGEASTLTPAERDKLIRTAVEASRGRVRVIAGAGSNSTSRAIELTKRAEDAGADAILSVVPYYNKPMQAGIEAHFHAVAEATALPVILHDIPSRTIRELSDNTLVQLAKSKQFIGLRDATGEIARIMRLRPRLPARFRLLSGDDTTSRLPCLRRRRLHIDGLERHAGFVPRHVHKLPAGTIAERKISAKPRRAVDGSPFQRKPGLAEICVEPARPDAPAHTPADHRIARSGKRARCRHHGRHG